MSGDFGDYYMASITRDGMGYMQIETPLALAHPVLASITRDGVHADRDTTGVGRWPIRLYAQRARFKMDAFLMGTVLDGDEEENLGWN